MPQPRRARRVHARLQVRSRVRRRSIELKLFDYYYLSVQVVRPGQQVSQYVLDLRFVDPALHLSRHIAWRWMMVAAVLAAMAAGLASWIRASSAEWWEHDWLPAFGTLGGLTFCAALISWYRTTRTLALYSVNGRARLLALTGGIGDFSAIRRFSRALAPHVQIAIRARRSIRGAHLRDEMREHLRLREAGVLSEQDYEASKRRILARHA